MAGKVSKLIAGVPRLNDQNEAALPTFNNRAPKDSFEPKLDIDEQLCTP
ncbi:hypothetical protein AGR4B_Lc10049 [Agrobacterium tumefaciens str. CFBP 5621]|jgi:hypothetical protein|nr:hypothetical protein AGR4B_Lc10049 [Agrobacterium tumefaciens str. CFBP 5621]